jgi:hypothetical protein
MRLPVNWSCEPQVSVFDPPNHGALLLQNVLARFQEQRAGITSEGRPLPPSRASGKTFDAAAATSWRTTAPGSDPLTPRESVMIEQT